MSDGCEPKHACDPLVYESVRAVGMLKPEFKLNSGGPMFAESLNVLGTAFSCRGSSALVTCAHVVKQFAVLPSEVAGLLVVGHQGRYMRAAVEIVDYFHDLAILRPESPEGLDATEDCGLEIAGGYPTVGTPVGYAGFPLGSLLLTSNHEPTYNQGVVGAKLREKDGVKTIQITGAVVGGFSGAPVVTQNDASKVIGVLSHSPSIEAGRASIFMAISWQHIAALLQLASS
jgi:S1-C subfamily serine protease